MEGKFRIKEGKDSVMNVRGYKVDWPIFRPQYKYKGIWWDLDRWWYSDPNSEIDLPLNASFVYRKIGKSGYINTDAAKSVVIQAKEQDEVNKLYL